MLHLEVAITSKVILRLFILLQWLTEYRKCKQDLWQISQIANDISDCWHFLERNFEFELKIEEKQTLWTSLDSFVGFV